MAVIRALKSIAHRLDGLLPLRAFFSLASNLLLARLLSISGLVAFAAIAGPEPFAPFGMYIAIVTVLSVLVCGRYEQAILFSPSERQLSALASLSFFVAVTVVVLVAVASAAVLLQAKATLPVVLSQHPVLLIALPIGLGLRAILRIALNIAVRKGEFHALVRANLAQATAQTAVQLTLIAADNPPVLSLVVADIAGLACAIAALTGMRITWRHLVTKPNMATIRAVARKWRDMPLRDLPSSLASVASVSIPAFSLPIAFSSGLAGQIMLGMRLLDFAYMLFSSAATPLLQRQLASARNKHDYMRTVLPLLFMVPFAMFGVIGLAFALGSGWLAGTRWSEAAACVPWLVLYFGALAASGPAVDLVAGVNAMREAAIAHGVFLLLAMLAGAHAMSGVDWRLALLGFGVAMLIRSLMFARILIQKSRSQNRAAPIPQ